jgi:hypothetical protein
VTAPAVLEAASSEACRARCIVCGGSLGGDRPSTATACSCHPEAAKPSYNPRHDAEYPDRLLNDLIGHKGSWRRLHVIYSGNHETVREAIEIGRRIGLMIEGDRALGYRYTGFRRIRKVHVAKAERWPADHRKGGGPRNVHEGPRRP